LKAFFPDVIGLDGVFSPPFLVPSCGGVWNGGAFAVGFHPRTLVPFVMKTRHASTSNRLAFRQAVAAILIPLLAFSGSPVSAADFSWDGGTNTWDNGTTLFWNTGGAWTSSANNRAIFGGTAGTVTLGEPITSGALTFNTAGYTVAGGGNALTLGNPGYTINSGEPRGITLATTASSLLTTISANTILANSQNWNTGLFNYLRHSGIISQAATGYGLSKDGTGTVALSNANTYSGMTTVPQWCPRPERRGGGGFGHNADPERWRRHPRRRHHPAHGGQSL